MKTTAQKPVSYPLTLTTKRLCLRSIKPSDAKALNRAVRESFPELSRWLPWALKIPVLEETEAFTRSTAAKFIQRQDYSFLITPKERRTPVGCIGLHSRELSVPCYEIGYWLHSAHTGQGFMTEAAAALVAWGRDCLRAKRIFIRAQTSNKASWSIPQRLGFKFEGIHRNQIRDNAGRLADMRIYATVFPDQPPI